MTQVQSTSYDRRRLSSREPFEDDICAPGPAAESVAEEEREQQADQTTLLTESKSNTESEQYSTSIHREGYIVALMLCYIALATFAWVTTCILTYKPIGARYYGVNVLNTDDDDGGAWVSGSQTHSLYVNSEKYYRAARVVQSIVAVLTIPLNSAVCAQAAIIFLQRHTHDNGLTMRKTMVLADKGCICSAVLSKLVFGQWKRYGSSFLFAAICLNLLGNR